MCSGIAAGCFVENSTKYVRVQIAMNGDGESEIQQLFRGAGVFVTGGTGFLGKVLL
jgi:hypothetical protein